MRHNARIYDLGNLARRMTRNIDEFLELYGDKKTHRPNITECGQMLVAILTNEIDRRAEWASPVGHEELFAQLLPWTRNIEKGYEYEDFYTQVIDRAVVAINRWLEAFMERGTWMIWEVEMITPLTISLVPKQDYRIEEWTRLKESGELEKLAGGRR